MVHLSVWFRDLFRPNIKHVKVKLFENGKERTISTYDENRLHILMKCIDILWETPQGSPYWFETECYEVCSCFKPRETILQVSCYTQDKNSMNLKVPMAIPIRYRKKMFDKKHLLGPKFISNIHWPERVEVQFINAEK